MKHTNLLFCLIIFLIPHITFSMEEVEFDTISMMPFTTADIDKIVTTIDDAINEKYCTNSPLTDFLLDTFGLSKEDMLAIIDITAEKLTQIATTEIPLLSMLCKKNYFFAQAINYVTELAEDNINAVDTNTLDIINNPSSQQFIEKLNTIPLIIKTYCMLQAYHNIQHEYEITLSHKSDIGAFDICPTTDMVATCSKNKKFSLWDLKTMTLAHTFTITDIISLIQFNNDGSQLVTVIEYALDNSIVKIWDTLSKELLYTIPHKDHIYHINFMHNSPDNIFCLFSQNYDSDHKQKNITLWSCNDTTRPTLRGMSSPLPWKGEHLTNNAPFCKANYTAYVDKSTLHITKKDCRSLYLCNQAVDNSDHTTVLDKIKKTQSYTQLTTGEQRMINTKIQKKNNPIQKRTIYSLRPPQLILY